MASSSHDSIPVLPAPWTLKGTVYIFMMYMTSKDAATLSANPEFIYSPLEAKSSFSKDKLIGGLSMVQLIKYSESPVGPYDEMVVIPGYFEYEIEVTAKDGKVKTEKRKNLRCTRVFVSQEKTCWNGRNNWNVPKHLAHFDFVDLPNGGTRIVVHPLLPDASGQERIKSSTPFFATTFKPVSYSPSFPSSTDWSKYIGWDLGLVQPPLLAGEGEELAGTDKWCKIAAVESSKKTSLGWFDLKQRSESAERDPLLGGDQIENEEQEFEGYANFWPGLGRWRIGIKMEDTVVDFPVGEHWGPPS
ncbi:uncharacterized protein PAC_16252 [Phialocephala subalpina]|uniref:Acetoacetate decarboxylase n=1 Tax=Phialocephala subalpina TaxID=576137 RepID=A0A1L7XMR7_9HELO|nr:uncharacterized protein PAC_16252 [Phialocephala subalpina]